MPMQPRTDIAIPGRPDLREDRTRTQGNRLEVNESSSRPYRSERPLRVGVVFPQTELGGDPSVLREYGQTVEALGFTHVLAYDHVVGADPKHHTGWSGPYDIHDTFHEPLVTFGFLAAVTTTLELVTGVVVLPQRQTVLVAKQAAEVDLLSNGRLRLGIALGWNAVEYEALGEDFTNRGRRSEEQVEVLRRLWTEEVVTFEGRYHRVTAAGLAPLPVQRPIPLWFGAASTPALARAGRLADGWFPRMSPGPELEEARGIVVQAAAAAGRDPSLIGMEGHVDWQSDPERVLDDIAKWDAAGATHVALNTMGHGLRTLDDHLEALTAVAGGIDAVGDHLGHRAGLH